MTIEFSGGQISDKNATSFEKLVSSPQCGNICNIVNSISVVLNGLVSPDSGHLTARLRSPGPDGALLTIFDRPGATALFAGGYTTNFNGTYNFIDSGASLWNAANNSNSAVNIPTSAFYRFAANQGGIERQVNAVNTLSNKRIDGVWSLEFVDSTAGTITNPLQQSISGATVTLRYLPGTCFSSSSSSSSSSNSSSSSSSSYSSSSSSFSSSSSSLSSSSSSSSSQAANAPCNLTNIYIINTRGYVSAVNSIGGPRLCTASACAGPGDTNINLTSVIGDFNPLGTNGNQAINSIVELFVVCGDGSVSQIDYAVTNDFNAARSNEFQAGQVFTDLLDYIGSCASSIPEKSNFFSPVNISTNKIFFSTDSCSTAVCGGKNRITAVYLDIELICCLYNNGSCLAALYLDSSAEFGAQGQALPPECNCVATRSCAGAAIGPGQCPAVSMNSNDGNSSTMPGGCTGCNDVVAATNIMSASFTGCPRERKLNPSALGVLQCTRQNSPFGNACQTGNTSVPYWHNGGSYNGEVAPADTINYGWICVSYETYGSSDRIIILSGKNRYRKSYKWESCYASDSLADVVYRAFMRTSSTRSGQIVPSPDDVMQLPLFGASSVNNNTTLECSQPGNSLGHYSPLNPPSNGYYSFAPFHSGCSIEGMDIPTCSIFHLVSILVERVKDLAGVEESDLNLAAFNLLIDIDPLGYTTGKQNVIYMLEQMSLLAQNVGNFLKFQTTVGDLQFITPKVFLWDPTNYNNQATTNSDKWKHIYHVGERNVIMDSGCIATSQTQRRLAYMDNILSGPAHPYRMITFMNCTAGPAPNSMLVDIDGVGCGNPCATCSGGCTGISGGTGSNGNIPSAGVIPNAPEVPGGQQKSLIQIDPCGSSPQCVGIWFNNAGELINCGGASTVEIKASSGCGCDCAPVDPAVYFTYEEALALAQTGCIVPSGEQVQVCINGNTELVAAPIFANYDSSCGSLWDEIACNCTCLAFGTKVLMADGTERSVESLRVGDVVLGIRFGTSSDGFTSMPDNNEISKGWTAPDISSWVFVPSAIAEIKLGFEQERYSIGAMSASFEHPVLIKDGNTFKFRSVSIISSDYMVVDRNLQLVGVSEVVKQVRPTMTVALRLNGAHALVAGGIIVHDGGIPASSTFSETGIALSSGIAADPCSKNLVI